MVGVEIGCLGDDTHHGRELRDRAPQRRPGAHADQLRPVGIALDPQRPGHLRDPVRRHPQADRALRAVLRSGQHLLGHRVQRPAGGDEYLFVHVDLRGRIVLQW